MITYKAIKINRKNSPLIANLVYKTYQNFNKHEADKKSLSNYLSRFDNATNSADSLAKRFKWSNINFGAFSGKKLIGIIRGKSNRIINLFVAGDFHNQGVGERLINLFERQAKKEKSKLIKIRSSLYAVGFYSKMGYKKTTGVRLCKGLREQPMKKEI